MRIKSRWHRGEKPKSMKQIASVMAMIIWRLVQHSLQNMRSEKYEIDPGPQYFAFMSEFMVFLIQVADRIAYQHLELVQRSEFITALAIRLAEILEDNQASLLGLVPGESYKNRFIALVNERAADYATFNYTAEGPDFVFVRYLGSCILELMGTSDKPWVIDQVIQIEAPEAVKTVQKSMRDLFPEPVAG